VSGAQAARERAARFVASRGDETARRRAAVLVGVEPPASADAALASWADRLGAFRGDGGVDPVAALPLLAALADLRRLATPLGEELAQGLAQAQAADGSFGCADSDEEERIFASGLIAGRLSGLRSVRARLLDGAADWLADRFTPERVAGFAWRPLAAYTACFANVSHERSDEVLQWCGRELERGFRARRFDAVASARILLEGCSLSLPGARVSAPELVVALISEQADDGGWPAPASADRGARVQHALDGLTALAHFA